MNFDQWIEELQEPRDVYDLAGLARFHPSAKEVLAALDRITTELNQHRAHWRNEVRNKAERLLLMAEQGKRVFFQDNARFAYDEQLFSQTAAAFHSAFGLADRQHDPVRRWLRMTQNVHASKVEEVLRRLASSNEKPAEIPMPAPSAKQEPPVASANPPPPMQSAGSATPIDERLDDRIERKAKSPARPPPRPVETSTDSDHFGLLWIVGTAVGTAIVFVIMLFFLFGDRFIAKREKSLAKGNQNTSPQEVVAADDLRPDPILPETKPETIPEKGTSPPVTAEETKEQVPKKSDAKPDNSKAKTKNTDKAISSDPNAPPPPEVTSPPKILPAPMDPPGKNPSPSDPAVTSPVAGNLARQVIHHGLAVHALAWNAAGDRLAVGGDGDTVRIWDVTKCVEAKVLKESFPSCASLSFGRGKLAAATGQGTVYVWNATTWKLEASLRHADMQDAKAVAWGNLPDAQVIVGDSEGNLRFLSVSGGNQTGVIELAKSAGGIQTLVATGKSRPIWVSGHLDGTVLIWSSAGKNVLNCLANTGASMLDAMVQPNSGASKSAQLTPHGKEICYDLAVSPDERLLAVAGQDVDLWELDSKNYLVRRRFVNGAKNNTGYRAADFSSDSKLLAVGAGDGTLAIIDIAAWTAVYQEKFPGPINRIAWRPAAAKQLAIACEDGTAVVLTLGKDAMSATVQSSLDPKQILTEAQQNAADEDWGTLAQRISYLSIYRLPSTEKNTLDSLRLKARKGAQALATSLNPKTVPQDELAEAADTLQQAIDLDPSGEGGKAAREALRQLPPLTVAMLKASADNGTGATRAGGKSGAGNPRGGPPGRRAGGAAMPGMPTKPVRKK